MFKKKNRDVLMCDSRFNCNALDGAYERIEAMEQTLREFFRTEGLEVAWRDTEFDKRPILIRVEPVQLVTSKK